MQQGERKVSSSSERVSYLTISTCLFCLILRLFLHSRKASLGVKKGEKEKNVS